MYVSDHQGGDLSDIIRSAGPNNQPETDTWQIPESIEQFPTDIKFNTDIHDSLLSSCFETVPEKSNVGNEMMINKPTGSIFSRVLQVSPMKPLPMVIGVDGDRTVRIDRGVQLSSPRVPPGMIKRRKSLAKKVVCIPAPAAASSGGSSNRPSSGEVVPSDLWAWRKYGQKPIKGSPFPRGYYRCSSSKGCSARKQVERSRTDPNMLVITYTSEHNHPWPTQRNVLAGSTRSTYPTKTQRPSSTSNSNSNFNNAADLKSTNQMSRIKEEASNMDLAKNNQLKFYNANTANYTAELSDDQLFADLAELESDPVSLIFEKTEHEDIDKSSFCNVFDWGESSLASLTDDRSK